MLCFSDGARDLKAIDRQQTHILYWFLAGRLWGSKEQTAFGIQSHGGTSVLEDL